MKAEEIFGELRAVLHASPSEQGWQRLTRLLERGWREYPEEFQQQWSRYTLGQLESSWPQALREAPERWYEDSALEGLLAFSGHPAAAYWLAQPEPEQPKAMLAAELREASAFEHVPALEWAAALEHEAFIRGLVRCGAGSVLSIDERGGWRRWELASGDCLLEGTLPGAQEQAIRYGSLAVHPRQEFFLCALWEEGNHRLLRVDLEQGGVEEMGLIEEPGMPGFALSPDGEHLLVASEPGALQLYQIEGAQKVWERPIDIPSACQFHPDGKHLVYNPQDGDDLRWESLISTSSWGLGAGPFEQSRIFESGLSSHGTYFATCSDSTGHVWELGSGREVLRFEDVAQNFSEASFCNQERLLLVAHVLDAQRMKQYQVWDVAQGAMIGQVFARGNYPPPGEPSGGMLYDVGNWSRAVVDAQERALVVSEGNQLRVYPLDRAGEAIDREVGAGPTIAQWRQRLEEISEHILSHRDAEDDLGRLPEQVRAQRWPGHAPASEEAIEAAEARLGRRLSPSMRSFYQVSNGWRNLAFFPNGLCEILPVEELFWASEGRGSRGRHVLDYELERDASVPYENLNPDFFCPWPELRAMLVVGDGDGNEYVFANPRQQDADGEWEIWLWDKESGFQGGRTFWEYFASALRW